MLMRLARRRPRLVEAVILFNADSAAAGWLEWGRGLVHAKSLAPAAAKGLGLPPAVAEWLVGDNENDREISLPPLLQVWHHLGGASAGRCPRLAESYRQHFLHHSHPANLLKLIQVRSHGTGEPPVVTCCLLLPPVTTFNPLLPPSVLQRPRHGQAGAGHRLQRQNHPRRQQDAEDALPQHGGRVQPPRRPHRGLQRVMRK